MAAKEKKKKRNSSASKHLTSTRSAAAAAVIQSNDSCPTALLEPKNPKRKLRLTAMMLKGKIQLRELLRRSI